MADDELKDRVDIQPEPPAENVESRADSVPEERDSADPEGQAEAVLSESEARKVDPAIADLGDDRIERRTSDERVGEEETP